MLTQVGRKCVVLLLVGGNAPHGVDLSIYSQGFARSDGEFSALSMGKYSPFGKIKDSKNFSKIVHAARKRFCGVKKKKKTRRRKRNVRG